MSRIPVPRTPADAEGGPDERRVQAAMDEIAKHLGPIDEVVRERMRRRLVEGDDTQS